MELLNIRRSELNFGTDAVAPPAATSTITQSGATPTTNTATIRPRPGIYTPPVVMAVPVVVQTPAVPVLTTPIAPTQTTNQPVISTPSASAPPAQEEAARDSGDATSGGGAGEKKLFGMKPSTALGWGLLLAIVATVGYKNRKTIKAWF